MKISFSKNDNELLKRIRSGEDKAMESVYLKYRNEFVNWSKLKYSVSQEDALDHYQDTLTILFEKVINGSITKIESSLKTYIYGIGKNKIRQQFDLQSKQEKHKSDLTEHYAFLSQNDELTEAFASAKAQTMAAFEQLGEQCKKLLRLFYFDKKSMTDIASILGHKNEGVSRTTKKRCIEKIRQQIKHPNK